MRKIFSLLFLATLSMTKMFAASSDTVDKYASITHIEALQWKVAWNDFDFISALDSEFDQNYAYLTDSKGKKTILHANLHDYPNPTIIFPDYGNFFTLNLEGLNLADGNYTLTIPESYVGLIQYGVSTEDNPAQELSLTIGGTPDISYDVRVSAIEGNYFDVTWENVTALAEGNTSGAYMVDIATNKKYELFFLEDYNYSKANLRIYNGYILRINITNNYPDLPSGTYKLYIPANYVLFNGTPNGNQPIDGHEFTYVKPWDEGPIEFNGPSDDNKLTLTWVDASSIKYDTSYPGDGNKIVGITIYDGNDTQINVPYATNISVVGNSMIIDLNGLNIADGECRVLVPVGCIFVTVGGTTDYNDENSFTFSYGDQGGDTTPDLYPGNATWSIRSGSNVQRGVTLVEVGWGYPLTIVDGAEEASIHSFPTGILYLEYGSEVYLSNDKTKLVLNLQNMPDGVFRINIAEACVEFDVNGKTYRNQSTSMDNITLGVDDAAIDSDNHIRIVDLKGRVIIDSEDKSDINKLPKGVYIINGKKVSL